MRSRLPTLLLVLVAAGCSLSPMVQTFAIEEVGVRVVDYHDERARSELADPELAEALSDSTLLRDLLDQEEVSRPRLKRAVDPVLERYRLLLSRDTEIGSLDRKSRELDGKLLQRVAERPSDG